VELVFIPFVRHNMKLRERGCAETCALLANFKQRGGGGGRGDGFGLEQDFNSKRLLDSPNRPFHFIRVEM
jgi:hypothetical protein